MDDKRKKLIELLESQDKELYELHKIQYRSRERQRHFGTRQGVPCTTYLDSARIVRSIMKKRDAGEIPTSWPRSKPADENVSVKKAKATMKESPAPVEVVAPITRQNITPMTGISPKDTVTEDKKLEVSPVASMPLEDEEPESSFSIGVIPLAPTKEDESIESTRSLTKQPSESPDVAFSPVLHLRSNSGLYYMQGYVGQMVNETGENDEEKKATTSDVLHSNESPSKLSSKSESIMEEPPQLSDTDASRTSQESGVAIESDVDRLSATSSRDSPYEEVDNASPTSQAVKSPVADSPNVATEPIDVQSRNTLDSERTEAIHASKGDIASDHLSTSSIDSDSGQVGNKKGTSPLTSAPARAESAPDTPSSAASVQMENTRSEIVSIARMTAPNPEQRSDAMMDVSTEDFASTDVQSSPEAGSSVEGFSITDPEQYSSQESNISKAASETEHGLIDQQAPETSAKETRIISTSSSKAIDITAAIQAACLSAHADSGSGRSDRTEILSARSPPQAITESDDLLEDSDDSCYTSAASERSLRTSSHSHDSPEPSSHSSTPSRNAELTTPESQSSIDDSSGDESMPSSTTTPKEDDIPEGSPDDMQRLNESEQHAEEEQLNNTDVTEKSIVDVVVSEQAKENETNADDSEHEVTSPADSSRKESVDAEEHEQSPNNETTVLSDEPLEHQLPEMLESSAATSLLDDDVDQESAPSEVQPISEAQLEEGVEDATQKQLSLDTNASKHTRVNTTPRSETVYGRDYDVIKLPSSEGVQPSSPRPQYVSPSPPSRVPSVIEEPLNQDLADLVNNGDSTAPATARSEDHVEQTLTTKATLAAAQEGIVMVPDKITPEHYDTDAPNNNIIELGTYDNILDIDATRDENNSHLNEDEVTSQFEESKSTHSEDSQLVQPKVEEAACLDDSNGAVTSESEAIKNGTEPYNEMGSAESDGAMESTSLEGYLEPVATISEELVPPMENAYDEPSAGTTDNDESQNKQETDGSVTTDAHVDESIRDLQEDVEVIDEGDLEPGTPSDNAVKDTLETSEVKEDASLSDAQPTTPRTVSVASSSETVFDQEPEHVQDEPAEEQSAVLLNKDSVASTPRQSPKLSNNEGDNTLSRPPSISMQSMTTSYLQQEPEQQVESQPEETLTSTSEKSPNKTEQIPEEAIRDGNGTGVTPPELKDTGLLRPPEPTASASTPRSDLSNGDLLVSDYDVSHDGQSYSEASLAYATDEYHDQSDHNQQSIGISDDFASDASETLSSWAESDDEMETSGTSDSELNTSDQSESNADADSEDEEKAKRKQPRIKLSGTMIPVPVSSEDDLDQYSGFDSSDDGSEGNIDDIAGDITNEVHKQEPQNTSGDNTNTDESPETDDASLASSSSYEKDESPDADGDGFPASTGFSQLHRPENEQNKHTEEDETETSVPEQGLMDAPSFDFTAKENEKPPADNDPTNNNGHPLDGVSDGGIEPENAGESSDSTDEEQINQENISDPTAGDDQGTNTQLETLKSYASYIMTFF